MSSRNSFLVIMVVRQGYNLKTLQAILFSIQTILNPMTIVPWNIKFQNKTTERKIPIHFLSSPRYTLQIGVDTV